MEEKPQEIRIWVTEKELQLVTRALQERALKLEEEDGDTNTIQNLNNLAYKFQEWSTNNTFRDKPIKP